MDTLNNTIFGIPIFHFVIGVVTRKKAFLKRLYVVDWSCIYCQQLPNQLELHFSRKLLRCLPTELSLPYSRTSPECNQSLTWDHMGISFKDVIDRHNRNFSVCNYLEDENRSLLEFFLSLYTKVISNMSLL